MRDGLGRLQRVVLLGGTSDIGLAIVRRLVATRAVSEVVLAGRDKAGLHVAAAELQRATDDPDADRPGTDAPATHPSVEVVALDATDEPARIAATVTRIVAPHTDVVVHAIGKLPHEDRDGDDVELAARVFDINTTGSGVMLLAAARGLHANGHGVLVALSSIAAVRARADNLVYGAAKAGYDALAMGLADQLAGSGAGVMVVRPGFVHSRMTATHTAPPFACQPHDVAEAIDGALDDAESARSATVVWVPRSMQAVAAGIRLAPAGLLQRAAEHLQPGE